MTVFFIPSLNIFENSTPSSHPVLLDHPISLSQDFLTYTPASFNKVLKFNHIQWTLAMMFTHIPEKDTLYEDNFVARVKSARTTTH